MSFYAIYNGQYKGIETRMSQLQKACAQREIPFIALDGQQANHTQLPQPGSGDMLYNVTRGNEALESLLLYDAVTTFYLQQPAYIADQTNTIKYAFAHQKAGLSQPLTIFSVSSDRKLLKAYVDYLGGFPVVIKVMGGTLGIGTMQVDSMAGLVSVVEYLLSANVQFVLRQFIKAKRGSRLYVLGDEVILAGDFSIQPDDFRNASTVKDLVYTITDYPDTMKQLAVDGTRLANVAFAGVDILEDQNGRFFLLEVNFPAGFALAEYVGFDLGGSMVDFLVNKLNGR